MVKYTCYNKMYYKGKVQGGSYKTNTGKTKQQATSKCKRANAQWNKLEKKSGYSVKISKVVKVGKTKTKKKKYSRSNPFDFRF